MHLGKVIELSLKDSTEEIINKVKEYSVNEGYSFSDLNEENKEFVLGYAFGIADMIHCFANAGELDSESFTVLGRLQREINEEFAEEVLQRMCFDLQMLLVCKIDEQED